MKRITILAIVALMVISIFFILMFQEKVSAYDSFPIKNGTVGKYNRPDYYSVCIDGYKFAIVTSKNGVRITQMYLHGNYRLNHIPQPIKCRQ